MVQQRTGRVSVIQRTIPVVKCALKASRREQRMLVAAPRVRPPHSGSH